MSLDHILWSITLFLLSVISSFSHSSCTHAHVVYVRLGILPDQKIFCSVSFLPSSKIVVAWNDMTYEVEKSIATIESKVKGLKNCIHSLSLVYCVNSCKKYPHYRKMGNAALYDLYALPWDGKCIRYANKYVRGNCCDG